MDYDNSAEQIIKNVGGKNNIIRLIHCSTRLRFTLKDYKKAKIDILKDIDGVLSAVNAGGQCQVVIGNDVVEMYESVNKQLGILSGAGNNANTSHEKWYQSLLDFIIAIFQPLVPAIAGGGVLKSLLMLLAMLGWLSEKSDVYRLLSFVGTAPLYFLPLLVAITTAQRLNVNILVSVSAVGTLILPDMITALKNGLQIFSINITNITYSSQVFPAILAVLLYSILEKYITKWSPKPLRIFLVPLLSMSLTVLSTLLVLGPLGYYVGQGFAAIIFFLFKHLGFIATALLAAFLPLMVATGMHKAMIPYAVASMSSIGRELIYLPASLAHNMSESGVCFAIAIKTKNTKTRATAISAGISALFGITEPALYGIVLQNKRALGSVMASSLLCGGAIGVLNIQAFALVGPGLASLPLFVDQNDPSNLIRAIWMFVVSVVVSFLIGFFVWKDVNEESTSKSNDILNKPISGQTIALSEVDDDVFSSRVLGNGVAIKPQSGELIAPTDGRVIMVYETGHALGFKTDQGTEILFHIGIDTVKLQGKYFSVKVKKGDHVKKGTLLIEFDLHQIEAAGFDPTVIMIVTKENGAEVVLPKVAVVS